MYVCVKRAGAEKSLDARERERERKRREREKETEAAAPHIESGESHPPPPNPVTFLQRSSHVAAASISPSNKISRWPKQRAAGYNRVSASNFPASFLSI